MFICHVTTGTIWYQYSINVSGIKAKPSNVYTFHIPEKVGRAMKGMFTLLWPMRHRHLLTRN